MIGSMTYLLIAWLRDDHRAFPDRTRDPASKKMAAGWTTTDSIYEKGMKSPCK